MGAASRERRSMSRSISPSRKIEEPRCSLRIEVELFAPADALSLICGNMPPAFAERSPANQVPLIHRESCDPRPALLYRQALTEHVRRPLDDVLAEHLPAARCEPGTYPLSAPLPAVDAFPVHDVAPEPVAYRVLSAVQRFPQCDEVPVFDGVGEQPSGPPIGTEPAEVIALVAHSRTSWIVSTFQSAVAIASASSSEKPSSSAQRLVSS